MNASKLFASLAAVVVAGSAFAADVPVAATAATTVAATATVAAAAAPAGAAAKSLNVPSLQKTNAGPTRAAIHAEAVEAARNHRSTEASQYDWFMAK